ncbi:MAG: hypothetical protein JZD41_02145 [Thermoproteus sp.]|nr:hypothetical protein [Thermoproteus sp.]
MDLCTDLCTAYMALSIIEYRYRQYVQGRLSIAPSCVRKYCPNCAEDLGKLNVALKELYTLFDRLIDVEAFLRRIINSKCGGCEKYVTKEEGETP